MAQIKTPLVTILAPWEALTVSVSRTLATWAMQDEARGFSLFPVSNFASVEAAGAELDRAARHWTERIYKAEIDVLQDAEGRTLGPSLRRSITSQEMLERQEELQRPAGLVLTAHGAEHCIQFSDRWLCTHPDFAPDGNHIDAGRINSPILFLNSCGLLRLGDSIVPQQYSLAARLFLRSAQVIGPYRTMVPIPQSLDLFVSALFEGEPLGRIVNRMNRQYAALAGGGAAFTMLGDASIILGRGLEERASQTRPLQSKKTAHSTARQTPQQERFNIEKLESWERISSILERCNGLSNKTLKVRNEFLQTFRMLKQYENAKGWLEMPVEAQVLENECAPVYDRLRNSVMADIMARIAEGYWLTSIFSPVSAPPSISNFSCPVCRSTGCRKRYDILDAKTVFAIRDECDCCGTQRDSIGRRGPKRGPVRARMKDGNLFVTVPPLRSGELGKVMLHRSKAKPLDWPRTGGTCMFPAAQLSMRGRRVVAALCAGHEGMEARYGMVFLPPQNGG